MPKHKHKNQRSFFVNKIILAVAIIEPLFTLPQAYTIFQNQNASDISLTTWVGFNILTAIWIWYSIVNKEKVVLLYQGLFFVFNTLVIIGALLYGGKWF
jgi:uncharacterized protein with PQ loop repeat